MSRETTAVTIFTCNCCGTSETIGGDYPESIMDEKGWLVDEVILGNSIDLCQNCTKKLKELLHISIEPIKQVLFSKINKMKTTEPSLLPSVPCCCACINPADGEEICESCANDIHHKCTGPL